MSQLTRRSFLRGLVAGVATVAIASKLAPALPKAEATFYAHERYSVGFTDHRGVFGSDPYSEALAKSMKQTKEHVTSNVLTKAFARNDYLTDEANWYLKTGHMVDGENYYLKETLDGEIAHVYPLGTHHLKAEHLADYVEAMT